MKEGTILTQKGEFGLEDLEQIHRYTRRPLTAAEVYAFPLVLCDNEIDRDQEAFTKAALETLAGLFLGKTGLFDHQHTTLHQTARIYHTEVVEHPDRVTRCGEVYCTLNAKAYLVRCPETEGLILSIDGGIRKEVSVSCQITRKTCSICGEPAGSCSHRPGQEYGGKPCCIRLDAPSDAYEWSFVAVPAQREAGVTKQHEQPAPCAWQETPLRSWSRALPKPRKLPSPPLSRGCSRTIWKNWNSPPSWGRSTTAACKKRCGGWLFWPTRSWKGR